MSDSKDVEKAYQEFLLTCDKGITVADAVRYFEIVKPEFADFLRFFFDAGFRHGKAACVMEILNSSNDN